MKTIIEDLVAKMEGKPETELPEGTTIRFEIGNTRLSCKATEEGLEIYKINDMGKEESRIMTVGMSSNKLYVR